VDNARQHLEAVKQHPILEPPASSPARSAIDPQVIRNLHAYVPLLPRELPSQDSTWTSIELWLNGWADVARLSAETSLVTWEVCI
jgi:hypothetical protein